jgi:fibronectin-binding autotransporter adhesin
MKLKRTNLFLLAAATLVVTSSVHAAVDQTWLDANVDNTWSTGAANWGTSPGSVWTNTNNAIFGGTGETVTATGTPTFTNLTVNGNYTISGTTGLAANSIITVASTKTAIMSGAISGTGFSLAKSGAGALTLSSANTYSGGTTLQAGTVTVGNAAAFGSGAISVTGNSKITWGAGVNLANNVSIASGTTLTVDNASFHFGAFSGVISGDGNLTAVSNLRLTGNNTFKGNFTANSNGYITAINDASFGDSTNSITFQAGSLSTYQAGAAVNLTRNIIITGGAIGLDVTSGFNMTLGGVISGTGGLNKMSGDMATLSGLNTYTGKTAVGGGALSINSIKNVGGGASALGGVTTVANGTIDINNGTLKYTGTGDTSDRVINLSGTTGGATLDQSGASGSLLFTSAFTATGAGIKTLTLQGSTAGTGEISGAIVNNSVTNTTSVVKNGTGTWTLSGANTYTGQVQFNAGVLAAGNNTAFGTGSLRLGGGTIASSDSTSRTFANSDIDFASNSTLGTATTGDLKFTGNLRLGGAQKGLTVNNGVTEFSGLVSSSVTNEVAVTKDGAGTLLFSGSNTFTRPIAVNAGTMKFAKTVSFYGGSVNSTSATKLTVASGATGAFNVGGTGEFSEANITTMLSASNGTVGFKTGSKLALDTTGGNFTYAADLANPNGGANSLGLTKLGVNTLTLNGNNTYSGGTTIMNGVLTVGHANALGTGGVTVSGGTLALGGYAVSNNIALNGGTLSGSAAATGTVIVGGNSAMTGTFASIDAGTIAARVIDATGGMTVNNLTGQGIFTGGPVTVTGTHNPGNSPGTQAFTDLTYGTGTVVNLEIAGNGLTSDSVVVGNLLTIATGGAGVDLNLSLFGSAEYGSEFWDSNHTFDLITFNSLGGNFDAVSLTGLGSNPTEGIWSFGQDSNSFNAVWTAVPEPSAALLGGLGLLALLRRRRN